MIRNIVTPALIATLCGSAFAQTALQPRMGDPVPGLTAAQLALFHEGLDEYNFVLSEADGLGPIFNDSSCSQCHQTPTVGGGSVRVVRRFGKAATATTPFDPLANLGGSLLQFQGLITLPGDSLEVIPPEADVIANRLTPAVFGAGLVEQIQDADILAKEINPPHPSVSGIAHMVTPVEGGALTPGKFGWKGGVPTMLTFSADASVNEMGLTNRFFQTENAPNGNMMVLNLFDTVPDPEDSMIPGQGRIDRQTNFQRYLAAPPQTPQSGMTGETIFEAIGCAACHTPEYVTGTAPELALSNRTIRPYSDYLLHDMGPWDGGGLGDGIVDGIASENEMLTRSLWGISQRESFLHDGRVSTGTFESDMDGVIQWHFGEGSFSKANYNNLLQAEKDQLIAFLGSLGRGEFDFDNDNDVDFFDWFFIQPDFTGPAPAAPVTADDPGALSDVDRDGDVDLIDFMAFQVGYTDNVI